MEQVRRVGTRTDALTRELQGQIRLEEWVAVDDMALPEERREQFLARRQAIELYLSGASDAQLRERCGHSRRNVYRLIVERCLQRHEDGELYGWRGALPFLRVQGYVRRTKPQVQITGSGAAGTLQWLFASAEGRELEASFREKILGRGRALEASARPVGSLFRWFINELRARGYEARGEWPFNVEKLGYVTVSRFIRRVMNENPRLQLSLEGGPDAQRKAKAGDGTRRPALGVFDRVECDAHKLDTRMVVMIPSPHGGWEAKSVHRLWVVVLIEVASRAVLGYALSMRKEVAAEDVLRAIKSALTRWTPREIQFSENAYADGAGLPSHRGDRFVGACWNEFSVDGALANICARVERPMREIVGAALIAPQDPSSYTSRRSKDDRPFIESFFGNLAQGWFHRLATTTGNTPAAKRGHDPDAAAHATQFQIEFAEELLDTLIANYNATPHSGLGYRSPLAQLEFLASRSPSQIRTADPDQVRRMVGIRRLCTVKGGENSGRRPHFNFANARYSAPWLALRPDLLGKSLWLHIENEDDARWATVSTQQGLFLGAVRAAPPWHQTPHTLFMRHSIRALDKRRLIHLSSNCDAVEELIRYAERSPDKKMKPHPAYLEARRVLRTHAEALAGQPMVARAGMVDVSPQPEARGTPQSDQPAALDPGETTSPPQASKQTVRVLPAMHKAKTW